MPTALPIGSLALIACISLFYWGTIDPNNSGGYLAPMLGLLLISVLAGIYGMMTGASLTEKIVSGILIVVPAGMICFAVLAVMTLILGAD